MVSERQVMQVPDGNTNDCLSATGTYVPCSVQPVHMMTRLEYFRLGFEVVLLAALVIQTIINRKIVKVIRLLNERIKKLEA